MTSYPSTACPAGRAHGTCAPAGWWHRAYGTSCTTRPAPHCQHPLAPSSPSVVAGLRRTSPSTAMLIMALVVAGDCRPPVARLVAQAFFLSYAPCPAPSRSCFTRLAAAGRAAVRHSVTTTTAATVCDRTVTRGAAEPGGYDPGRRGTWAKRRESTGAPTNRTKAVLGHSRNDRMCM